MSVVKNSAIYLGSSIISKASPFVLLPFLTQVLEPEAFGILSVFLVFLVLFTAFIGMLLDNYITKNFYSKSKAEIAISTGNIFIILAVNTFLFSFLSLMTYLSTDNFFSIPTEYLLIFPILSFLTMTNKIHLTILRNEGKAYKFGAYEILNAVLILVVTLYLLLNTKLGWLSQVIGIATASTLLAIMSTKSLYENGYLKFDFTKTESVSILKLSIPLIPHAIGGVIIAVSDRLFIEHFMGLEAVALYAIGYNFGMVVSLFTDALIKAWSPWFYQQLVNPTHAQKSNIVKSTYLYLLGVFVVAYTISVLGEYILPYVVDERYRGAEEYIWWIALGYAVHGVYKIFFPYLVHISKTGFLAFSTVMAAIINLFLNYLLIPEYGAVGAAYATIMAFTVSALLVFEYQRRNFPMPWLLRIS